MSVESYIATLPEGEREEALLALQAQSRDPEGNVCAVYAHAEAYTDAGWRVTRPLGRGRAVTHPDAKVPTASGHLGTHGLNYLEWLGNGIDAEAEKQRKAEERAKRKAASKTKRKK